jgi:hypothetical protein
MTTGFTTANASPSKGFFVSMLVRDIELKDTLLDLLDNCVDGILRSCDPDLESPQPYLGFWANIAVGPDCFEIEDNCGGIPIELARTRAFAIGRPDRITGPDGAATVGMYGIGMKRAIFKLGRNAVVESWHDEPFRVRIDRDWLDSDDWSDLPMETLEEGELLRKGTRIQVDDLHDAVKLEFDAEAFATELAIAISRSYSLIIAKGFRVTVRRKKDDQIGPPIAPEEFRLLGESETGGAGMAPYIYCGEIGDVTVEVYAGLYRKLPDADEAELEEDTRGKVDDAGWTVACNDRVVIWKDRSRLTGWGEASVPNFHGQFIAIAGLVLLRSTDPSKLPLTTTKRGIDASSDVFSYVKDMMREATKALTSFTNKWKRFEENLDQIYRGSAYLDLPELRSVSRELPMRTWAKMESIKRYVPKLPSPPREKTSARVSFVAVKADVVKLAVVYFDNPTTAPKHVGEEAFKRELANYAEAAE